MRKYNILGGRIEDVVQKRFCQVLGEEMRCSSRWRHRSPIGGRSSRSRPFLIAGLRIQWGIMAPITSDDVKRTLAGMKDGAPSPDGRRPKDLKNIPIQELVAHYNLWLLAGYQPEALRRRETVLLPKEPGNKKPEVIRCFHRILAKRMENLLPFNSGQKAFMATDGVAESVWFLSSVINQHKADLQPINIAFVDVTKAFDSVSHNSLLIAAERLGVPPPFLTFLSSLYGGAQTVLRIGPQRSLKLDLSWLWC